MAFKFILPPAVQESTVTITWCGEAGDLMFKSKILALPCLGSNLGSAAYYMCHYYLSASLMSGISWYLSVLHREGLWAMPDFWLIQIRLLPKSWYMSWWPHGYLFVRYKPRNRCACPKVGVCLVFVDTAMHFLKDILSTYIPPGSSNGSTSLPTLGIVSVGLIIALKKCCYGRLQQKEPLQQMLPVLTSPCPGEMRVLGSWLRVCLMLLARERLSQLGMSAWENCKSNCKLINCIAILTHEFGFYTSDLWIWLTFLLLRNQLSHSEYLGHGENQCL